MGKKLYQIYFLKKISFYIVVFITCNFSGNAQFIFGEMYLGQTLQKKDSIARQDRLVFEISHELILEKPKGYQSKFYSFGLGMSRMFEFPFSRGFSFAIGPGFRSLHHYHNSQYSKFVNSRGELYDSIQSIHSSINYSINKTVLNFVDVTAELRIKSGKEHKFKVYLGFKAGCLFNQHEKYVSGKIKFKSYNTNGFNKISFGPVIRIGYNNVCLFANYLLSPIYENNRSQKIQSVSAGLTFFWL